MTLLGIDEAGRGPVVGPMVVAGVLVDDEKILKQLKVRDSKKLTPRHREELYPKILDAAHDHREIILQPDQIDAAVDETKLNWLEADAMITLIQSLKPSVVFLDCPSNNIKKFSAYIREKISKRIKIVAEHKADENYAVVAAASIIAKVTRDREIENLRRVYGDFGSGYPADPKTAQFIKEHHELPIYRKSWSSWQKVARAKQQKKLADF